MLACCCSICLVVEKAEEEKMTQISHDNWPSGISDGLTLPCGICKQIPNFDTIIDDVIWKEVAPEEHCLSVICLPCFDKLAEEKGISIAHKIIEVQFTGIGKTVCLNPTQVYEYEDRENKMNDIKEEVVNLKDIDSIIEYLEKNSLDEISITDKNSNVCIMLNKDDQSVKPTIKSSELSMQQLDEDLINLFQQMGDIQKRIYLLMKEKDTLIDKE